MVVLLFLPPWRRREWLQDATSAPRAHGLHDAFAASLSCVLPDFFAAARSGRCTTKPAFLTNCCLRTPCPPCSAACQSSLCPHSCPTFWGLQAHRPRPGTARGESGASVPGALQPALIAAPPPGPRGQDAGMGPEAGVRT